MFDVCGILPLAISYCTQLRHQGVGILFPEPFPVRWDPLQEEFTTVKSLEKRWSLPFLIMLAGGLGEVLFFWKNSEGMSVTEKALFFRVTFPYVIFSTMTIRTGQLHGAGFASILNALLRFERTYVDKVDVKEANFWRDDVGGKGVRRFMKLSKYLRATSIWMSVISATTGPHLPFNPACALTPFWVDHVEKGSWLHYLSRGAVFVVAGAFWYVSAHALFFGYMVHFIMAQFVLKCLVQHLQRCTAGRKYDFERLAQMQREVEVIILAFNDIHALHFNGTLVVTLMGSNIATSYALLTQSSKMSGSAFGSVLEGYIASTLMLLMGTRFAAKVNFFSLQTGDALKASLAVVAAVRRGGKGLSSKSLAWMRKFRRSCRTLRIQFFMTSFFEQLTPLIIMQFCFDTMVSLVLLRNK